MSCGSVTPGTLNEESLLEARRHNYLAAFAEVRERHALAWVDISTRCVFRDALPCRVRPETGRSGPVRADRVRGEEARFGAISESDFGYRTDPNRARSAF